MSNIVETAAAAGQFNTLARALDAGALVDTLSGGGPYTVFAPTDEAFSKLPKEELEGLLADKERLKKVLTYHVVPGKVTAADVSKMKEGAKVKTVEGDDITLHFEGEAVKLNDAKVTQTDITASNGVIHVIDKVLMPS